MKYRHISAPSVLKEYDSHIAFLALPDIFRGNRTQSEFDEFERRHFERDKKKGIVLEYSIINEKEKK